ncbi:MAG: M15 family metallopeptidase [bacterium]|nr:M15 family metallopeptidase [bacterium]
MEKILNQNELDIELIKQLQELAKENKFQEYLYLLNKNLEKLKIEECNEPLLYLPKHLSKDIFIKPFNQEDDPEVENKKEYEKKLFLRKKVVDKINHAQDLLPKGYHLLIMDALRTEDMVWKLYKNYFQKKKKENPELSDKEIDLWLRNLLAMPDDPAPPGHMTGGAVDIALVDNEGKEIPLEIDYEIVSKEEQKFTFCPRLPQEIIKKRKILYDALTREGFHNYSREYWHYSYGDPYWAVRRKNKVAIYGIPRKDLFEKIS